MGSDQIAGAVSQIWKGQTRTTDSDHSPRSRQRHLLRGSLGRRLATAAKKFWPLANRLWLLPCLVQDWTWKFIPVALGDWLAKSEGPKGAPNAPRIYQ